jgi:hypothetical protein
MIDTVQNLTKIIEKTADSSIELINKVDSFYNSAWDKLIIVGSVSLAIIGILVPFIIQLYQKKTLKISEESLKRNIDFQASKIKDEVSASIQSIIDDRIKTYETKIKCLDASVRRNLFLS